MKKLLFVLLVVSMMLVGCSKQPSTTEVTEELTVLSPKGAPALGLLGYYDLLEDDSKITTVDGADVLTAALSQPESEYDIVVAPINLGATLIKKGATDYRLAGVLTWGNLYVVSSKEDVTLDNMGEFVAFGQNAVPGKVFTSLWNGKEEEVTWYGAVSDVAPLLISGKAETGLVAEPVCSTILAKTDLKVVVNVQEEWFKKTGMTNYPQAAVFVKPSVYEEKKDAVDAILSSFLNLPTDEESLKNAMNSVGQEALGVAAETMTLNAFGGMNLGYVDAKECEGEISAFLALFGMDDPSDLYLK